MVTGDTGIARVATYRRLVLHQARSEVTTLWFVAATAAWTLVTWRLAVIRHEGYGSYLHDLGIFEHLIWNTTHGHLFESSIYPANYLGFHFSPALALFAPGYLIWPDARSMLLMQSVVIATGSISFFLLARRRLGPGRLAALFGLTTLLSPYNLFLALADFHPDTLALPALGGAFYALETRRDRLLAMTLSGLLLIREDFALAVAGLGLYVAIARGRQRLGAGLLFGSLAYLSLQIFLVMPAIAGQPYPYGDLNPGLGTGPVGVLIGAMRDPLRAMTQLIEAPRPEYLLWLLAPWVGLPLLRPLYLLPGLPLLLRNLISSFPNLSWINRHFHAAIAPAFAYAALAAVGDLPRAWARRAVLAGFSATLVFNAYALYGLVGTEIPTEPLAQAPAYRAVLERVPPEALVAASNRLGAQLAGRRHLWFFPGGRGFLAGTDAAEWVAVDLDDRPGWLREQTAAEVEAQLREIHPPARYAEVYRSGNVILLQRSPDRADDRHLGW